MIRQYSTPLCALLFTPLDPPEGAVVGRLQFTLDTGPSNWSIVDKINNKTNVNLETFHVGSFSFKNSSLLVKKLK